jgi:hypothetical protein
MGEVERLEAEVARLAAALHAAREALLEARIAPFGFHEGEIVEARSQYGPQEWRRAMIQGITAIGDRASFAVAFANKRGVYKTMSHDVEVRKLPLG